MNGSNGGHYYPGQAPTYYSPYASQSSFAGLPDSAYQGTVEDSYWPPGPQPLVHEGFIPRDPPPPSGFISYRDLGPDEDEDPETYGVLSAHFGMQSILNPVGVAPPPFYEDDDILMEDDDLDDDGDLQEETLLNQELEMASQDRNNEEVDPDFHQSDEEASGDDMSVDSELEDIARIETSARGKASTRGRPRGSGRGRGRRGWKWALKGTAHDPDLEKRASGRPKGSKNQVPKGEGRKRGTGKAKAVDPGAEFKKHQALATQKFLGDDLEGAAHWAREAVKANPEVYAAHSLLSEILQAQGKEQDALTVLSLGAITKRDPGLWHFIAEQTLLLAGDDRTLQALDSAIYAYTWAIKLDPKDYDARLEKLNLLLESHNTFQAPQALGRAKSDCKHMIKLRPSDMPVVQQFAELAVTTKDRIDIMRAREAFAAAIEVYSKGKFLGSDSDEQWAHVNTYVELVLQVDGAIAALKTLKSLSRWLLGRKEETYWDDFTDDDREYDMEDEPRRIAVESFREQERREKSRYGEGLSFDLRIRLGLLRMALGPEGYHEALQHLEHALKPTSNAIEHSDSFREIADCLRSRGLYVDAIKFYEPLNDIPDAIDVAYYMDLAQCYMAGNRRGDAEDCYKVIVEANADEVPARIALAKMYEDDDRGAEALPLIEEVIKMGKRDAVKKANITIQPAARASASRRTLMKVGVPRTPRKPRVPKTPKTPKTLNTSKASKVNATGDGEEDAAEAAEEDENSEDSSSFEDADHVSTFEATAIDPTTNSHVSVAPKLLGHGIAVSGHSPTRSQDSMDIDESTNNTPVKEAKRPRLKQKPVKKTQVPTQPRMNPEQATEKLHYLRSMDERIRSNKDALTSCREDMNAGDYDALDMWLAAASSLVGDFRSMRVFYPGRDKHIRFTGYGKPSKILDEMEAMRDRLQEGEELPAQAQRLRDGVPDDFHGLLFEEWLDIFCELSIRLAHQGQLEQCYDNLQAASYANVFYHDAKACHQIHACWLACALILNDEDKLCSESRWYASQGSFAAGPYQLFAAVNRLFTGSASWFNSGPTQKFMLRAIKAMDFAILDPDQRAKFTFTTTEISTYTARGSRLPNHAGLEELDPGLLTLYGHILAAAQTWSSALNYYLRAFAIEPNNVTINLCIALAYIQMSMKRQAENRHWQIMQGLAFLNRYYAIRTRDGAAIHCQEAEYNIARAWHLLGINHIAMIGYRRCLMLRDKVQWEGRQGIKGGEEDIDLEEFTQEAALALVNIFAIADNNDAARAVALRYLVL